jgi:PIF1-like helicase
MIFVLAHFKPFSALNPLIPEGQSFQTVFKNYQLSDAAHTTIRNWDATNESEDARDAERMKKKAQMTSESKALTNSLFLQDSNVPIVEDNADNCNASSTEFAVNQQLLLLHQSDWFNSPTLPQSPQIPTLPNVTDKILKNWTTSLKQQEANSMQQRQCEEDIHNPVNNPSAFIPPTEAASPFEKIGSNKNASSNCPHTEAPNLNTSDETTDLDPEEIINQVGSEHQLNSKQWVAFQIIARSFIKTHLEMSDTPEPIRILLTGPGGTGKTHVVNALRALMEIYGSEHTLRFLAPTGSAASLIDGMTIHKGLGIKIKSNQKGKGNREPGESSEDYTVLISVRNRTLLRDEWQLVKVLFIDEVSLLSEQLMSEIDHALRYATEQPDEWFGGISVIFAGDFFQYPPICATPLYSPIPDTNGRGKDDIPCHLGRLAWKSVNAVITLTEQQRMKGDPEYTRCDSEPWLTAPRTVQYSGS